MQEERERYHAELKKNLEIACEESNRRVKEERERWTSIFPTKENDDVCEPLGRPEHREYIIVADRYDAGASVQRFLNRRDLRYYDRPREHRFRVTQHAHVLPSGLKVVWYGLEFCG